MLTAKNFCNQSRFRWFVFIFGNMQLIFFQVTPSETSTAIWLSTIFIFRFKSTTWLVFHETFSLIFLHFPSWHATFRSQNKSYIFFSYQRKSVCFPCLVPHPKSVYLRIQMWTVSGQRHEFEIRSFIVDKAKYSQRIFFLKKFHIQHGPNRANSHSKPVIKVNFSGRFAKKEIQNSGASFSGHSRLRKKILISFISFQHEKYITHVRTKSLFYIVYEKKWQANPA